MRTSEWIQGGFSVALALAAWLRPLPLRRALNVSALALGTVIVILVAQTLPALLSPLYAKQTRDWLTVGLLLIPYWQTGQFFLEPNVAIQNKLLAFDRWLMPKISETAGTSKTGIGWSLEVAYLFCYPLVPLGLLVLYAAGLSSKADAFWLVVLSSTYVCYAITPFVPALPPRGLALAHHSSPEPNNARILNRWILKHGSIHAISFPSGHVASSLAVALVLLRFVPSAGLAFFFVALCIAIGAVVGRYHYALDVLLGALIALITFVATYPYF